MIDKYKSRETTGIVRREKRAKKNKNRNKNMDDNKNGE